MNVWNYDSADRAQAIDIYLKAYPDDAYSEYLHVVADDENFGDYFVFSAITRLARSLMDDAEVNLKDENNKNLWRQFRFLVGLLDLPLPE